MASFLFRFIREHALANWRARASRTFRCACRAAHKTKTSLDSVLETQERERERAKRKKSKTKRVRFFRRVPGRFGECLCLSLSFSFFFFSKGGGEEKTEKEIGVRENAASSSLFAFVLTPAREKLAAVSRARCTTRIARARACKSPKGG